jgi:hypothetical protein
MVLSKNTRAADIPLYYAVLLDHDAQCLTRTGPPYESAVDAFNHIKNSIMYTHQNHPHIRTFFSVCENYSKLVPMQFEDLDIFDDASMMQMLLSIE